MTTAHRPTWNAAIASGSNPGGNLMVAQTTKVANEDAASMLKIKYRQASQGAPDERVSRREFREELERKEQRARDEREGKGKQKDMRKHFEDNRAALEDNPFPEDADEDMPSEKASDDEDDNDDDDEEDTEELMRELAKIKKEREAEEEKRKEQQKKQDDRQRRDAVMQANPLMASGDLSLKRRWDDDTVFKNQAQTAPKQKQRFINDAVRSDFHKKFLSKYVWMDGHA
eukprot:CAMPEP_0117550062 /NCGR_PEP_ID=MMETSP0784-20121206/48485_1 /TAXON_ID=39447 /ORGANISM="" /LENGTH=228 /DNA_ID=CAMNT_0005347065 /DNA_START=72 /DNA_END=755 /DNA_ORIENTATION=+